MILHQEMFQKLVDKIISDIGYNINIIDRKGYIIASGSCDRLGSFHPIGYEAAKNETRIDIDEYSVGQYKGVQQGINQPFYYNGELVGVIGITGNSAEISEFVRVVKTMIELMVEQELLKEKMYYRQSNKSYFANLLLNIKSDEDKLTLLRWAKKLGYQLERPRAVLVVSFDGQYDESVYTDILQQLKKVAGHSKEDFSSMIGSDQLLILKTVSKSSQLLLTGNQELMDYGQAVLKELKSIGLDKVYIGIASIYHQVEEHQEGYAQATYVIKQLKVNLKAGSMASIYDYLLEYVASYLPDSFLQHFVADYYDLLSSHEELLETLAALYRSHMNLVETAKSLFVHRNTVVFRMNKIKEITGLDPTHKHVDQVMCHLLTVYNQELKTWQG